MKEKYKLKAFEEIPLEQLDSPDQVEGKGLIYSTHKWHISDIPVHAVLVQFEQLWWTKIAHSNSLWSRDFRSLFLATISAELIIPEWLFKTTVIIEAEEIPNPRDPDYFYLYQNPTFKESRWYSQLFNHIHRCLYFMTGPKFVVPILGIVQEKSTIYS